MLPNCLDFCPTDPALQRSVEECIRLPPHLASNLWKELGRFFRARPQPWIEADGHLLYAGGILAVWAWKVAIFRPQMRAPSITHRTSPSYSRSQPFAEDRRGRPNTRSCPKAPNYSVRTHEPMVSAASATPNTIDTQKLRPRWLENMRGTKSQAFGFESYAEGIASCLFNHPTSKLAHSIATLHCGSVDVSQLTHSTPWSSIFATASCWR